jgi:glycosyltransferase involved in cell wall biosynthesis
MPDLLILIPVYQGAATVGEVVRGARAGGHPVLAVDDGSTDASAAAAEGAGATVLRHPANPG